MKSLKECVLAAMATPANTMGMGNPSIESAAIPINGKPRKLKKLKKKKHKTKE